MRVEQRRVLERRERAQVGSQKVLGVAQRAAAAQR